jgi:hypothetical protein
MSLLVTYEAGVGAHSAEDITDRVRVGSLDVTQNAEEGSVAMSTMVVDDPDGDYDIHGYRRVAIYETAGTVDETQLTYNGFIVDRRIIRGPYRTGPGRQWVVSMVDTNCLLEFRVMVGTDADRPAETDVERMDWLMSTSEMNRIPNLDFVNTSGPVNMDAADYRGQRGVDILNDCAQASGKNYFAFCTDAPGDIIPDAPGKTTMWYDFADSSEHSSTLKLSNDLDDVLADPDNTFYISLDTELVRDPSRVYSGGYVRWDGGDTFVEDLGISNEFTRRDCIVPAENVKSSAKATARINRYLADMSTEEDRIRTAIRLPAAKVNLVREGMRALFRATHLPGYATFVWLRVLRRTIKQESEEEYLVTLELGTGPTTVSDGELAFRQSNHGPGTNSASLSEVPLAGSLVLLQLSAASAEPTGFTDLFAAIISTGSTPPWSNQNFRLWYRVVQPGDTATFAVPGVSFEYAIAEFTGGPTWTLVASDEVSNQGAGVDDHPHKTLSPVYSGQILVVGCPIHNNTTTPPYTDAFVPDSGWIPTVIHMFTTQTVVMGMIHKIETNTGSYDPGVSTVPFVGDWGCGAFAWRTGP